MTNHAPDDLLGRASLAYTAGPQRQAIYLAHWLLGGHRTEDELCDQLQHVLDEIFPPRREEMLKKALAKLKTPDARKFIASCRREGRRKAKARN